MHAEILGAHGDAVGVEILDNEGEPHVVGVRPDGTIRDHTVDAYADDPAGRTAVETEHVRQARRLALYVVYREQYRDVLPALEHPDRIAAVALAVGGLARTEFERYFGDYYRQMQSEVGAASPEISVPDHARADRMHYEQDVYLSLDGAPVSSWAALFGDIDGARNLVEGLDCPADTDSRPADAFSIDAVSGVHVRWQDEQGEDHWIWGDHPALDRDPDARVTLAPVDPGSLAEFQRRLVHHLRCQVRDCYLGMGIAPPEPVRVLGPGLYNFVARYRSLDTYEPYHDRDARIRRWQEPFTPEDLRV